jgi:hypothetical protein
MSNHLEKWESLLARLTIDRECLIFAGSDRLSTLSPSQLQDFESRAGFQLPEAYKGFCQVFGSGKFGLHGFRVECPHPQHIETQLIANAETMQALKFSYKSAGCLLGFEELLDAAYQFGGTGEISLVIDPRTYSVADQSCDIYGIGEPELGKPHIYQLGRDFFKFVGEICMGDRAQQEFPELFVSIPEGATHSDPRNHRTTFIAFPLVEEDGDHLKVTEVKGLTLQRQLLSWLDAAVRRPILSRSQWIESAISERLQIETVGGSTFFSHSLEAGDRPQGIVLEGVYIKTDLLEQLNASARRLGIDRNQWIQAAIYQKLERDDAERVGMFLNP